MANDRTDSGDLPAAIQEMTGQLDAPSPAEAQGSLAYDLTSVVDDIRTIASDMGVRPYRVFMVHGVWSGAKRGEGTLQVNSRREITPVPRVRDMASVRRNLRSTGLTEEGDVVVDRISARYTEDDLIGLTPDLQSLTQPRTLRSNVEFWYEIEENRPSRPNPVPRRFSPPVSVPTLSRAGMSWSMALTKQDYNRGRTGTTVPRNEF